MQVSVETTSGLERRLTIAIPAAKIQDEVNKRIQQVAPKVKLDGFRPGKVPMNVVRQRFGEGIRQEVLGEMMSSSFQDAVIQEKLKPAGQPTVEPRQIAKDKDFSFTAVFEVYPEFTVKGLVGVSISRPDTEVTEADVDEMITILRKQKARYEKTEGAVAESGDQINIDFEGFKDGVVFEGGKAEHTDLVLGSKTMIPGFEDGLAGVKAGDKKELCLKFPVDYHAENLKGADVIFKVTVNSVSKEQLPAIDEKFMETFGVKDGSTEAFRAEIKKNMERELRHAKKNRIKKQVMDAILELNKIEIPGALIKQEIDVLRRQMFQQFGGGNQLKDFDLNMLPAEMFSDQAARRVSLGLLFSRLIEENNIKPDVDKVRETVEEIASSYEAKDEVIKYYYNNRQQLAQVEAMVLEEQAVDKLLQVANVADEKLNYQELMRLVSR